VGELKATIKLKIDDDDFELSEEFRISDYDIETDTIEIADTIRKKFLSLSLDFIDHRDECND